MEGILPLWKPKGLTSHDCVFRLRKILHMKRIGHTGTLDPDVTGVLPICLGRATKVAEYITDAGKEYVGEVTIGYSTTTEDRSGEKVEEKKVAEIITRDRIEAILRELTGEITQTPPMYSAVKVNGKRLYEYARQGIEIDRPSRQVNIYSLDLIDEWQVLQGDTVSFRFRVSCSKGTYIRTLAVMIGEKLGYPAHMSDLCRTRSAAFTKQECVTFEELEKYVENGKLENYIYPLEDALLHLPKYEINDTLAMKVRNGTVLETPAYLLDEQEPIVIQTTTGEALAIYVQHPTKQGLIKPSKILKILE
ncbi:MULTISPECIES: tRNA pseudouridine(55) synthase TruB [Niallia]|uniref:tRNA pseudouridine synthase B n=1 Tax=Niallia circulans TaxID=1397 RepID=A0A268FFX2_NIACI|nr:tRNA pseudouridine(55) synthase TruB [Niallia circulans]AYV66053.1 tRNA pseudouridine(55) synthase TruB [Niallia circulans]AYV71128.1 tRNA pseudouridine(55) synthase TruB [Niallia circulans]NRG29782.1 tRNA pseudouridine(55) synthase TruB [Niallia circulans]PAD84281.1 tRNA pseudouridine(55) synthase TruB [Niallia circulans]